MSNYYSKELFWEIIKYDVKIELIFNYTYISYICCSIIHIINIITVSNLYINMRAVPNRNHYFSSKYNDRILYEFEITWQITLSEKLLLNYVSSELYKIFKNTSLV